MPLYEYICENCQKSFTLLQRMGATEKDTTCPYCGSTRVRKLVSAFSCSSSFGGYGGVGFSGST